jgi:hypothetical protein
MTCSECGREHVIEGRLVVDGAVIPVTWLEVLAELLCRHGKLVLVEPD